LLRKNVRDQTRLGKQAAKYMKHGKLVPDDLIMKLVSESAKPILESGRSLLLDGFPRTLEQAKAFDDDDDPNNGTNTVSMSVDHVVHIDVPIQTIIDRISDRWIHAPSGRVYSYGYKPPKQHGVDDITGEPLIQRDDDKPESVRTRLLCYENDTQPLIEYYNSRGVLQTFKGTMSDVIYPQVQQWLREKGY
jgi:nucleoside-triphosphate--adenylate kinase